MEFFVDPKNEMCETKKAYRTWIKNHVTVGSYDNSKDLGDAVKTGKWSTRAAAELFCRMCSQVGVETELAYGDRFFARVKFDDGKFYWTDPSRYRENWETYR